MKPIKKIRTSLHVNVKLEENFFIFLYKNNKIEGAFIGHIMLSFLGDKFEEFQILFMIYNLDRLDLFGMFVKAVQIVKKFENIVL